jgi:uncharacterized protein YcaQ
MACIYAITEWPNFSYRRKFLLENPDSRKPSETILKETIENIRTQGPLSSLDFKKSKKIDWHWGPTKAIRASMEYLYSCGKLGIHHRINNRRYFDLIENLIPNDILYAPNPFDHIDEYQDWHILRRVGSLGIAQIKTSECWGGILNVKAKERNTSLIRLTRKKCVIPVEIKGLPGQTMFIRSKDLPVLEGIKKKNLTNRQAVFIAPLDNLLWNRRLIEDLFDFRYRWEVYKPKAQREFGYYVLPVIYGDQFIARIEPKFDKKKRNLTLKNWWWEPGIEIDKKMRAAIQNCIATFSKYLEARRIDVSNSIQESSQGEWHKDINEYIID